MLFVRSMFAKNVLSSKMYSTKSTTLQSIMNAKLSQHRFWHCHENGVPVLCHLIKNCVSIEVAEGVKSGLKLNLRLPSTSLNAKINTKIESGENEIDYKHVYINENKNLEKNQITQFDILKNYLIAGNNNGILSIWDIDTAELLNSKQLFGIITGLLSNCLIYLFH